MVKRMPAGWTPPYPSWSVEFDAGVREVVMAYFGVQKHGAKPSAFAEIFLKAFAMADGPNSFERARYDDTNGCPNEVLIAYWTSPDAFARWQNQAQGLAEWWGDPRRLKEEHGYWREILRLPLENFETLFSSEHRAGVGVGDAGKGFKGPIAEHGYWGGSRDRIPLSATEDLASTAGSVLTRRAGVESRGLRLVVRPPANFSVIRSGQNWAHCPPAELETYMTSVHPVLIKGMDFLAENPFETGCATCRFMAETGLDGSPRPRTFGLAYFLSLQHLEDWAKTHPTHLAIFGEFHRMAVKHNFDLGLRLWHEISVLPATGCHFEYVNCDPETGLLPYFNQSEA